MIRPSANPDVCCRESALPPGIRPSAASSRRDRRACTAGRARDRLAVDRDPDARREGLVQLESLVRRRSSPARPPSPASRRAGPGHPVRQDVTLAPSGTMYTHCGGSRRRRSCRWAPARRAPPLRPPRPQCAVRPESNSVGSKRSKVLARSGGAMLCAAYSTRSRGGPRPILAVFETVTVSVTASCRRTRTRSRRGPATASRATKTPGPTGEPWRPLPRDRGTLAAEVRGSSAERARLAGL